MNRALNPIITIFSVIEFVNYIRTYISNFILEKFSAARRKKYYEGDIIASILRQKYLYF